MKMRPFLEALRTETLGFNFGDPWRGSETSTGVVLPIIRERKDDAPIKYLLLCETNYVEIVDTGKIDEALIVNKEELPVFIRMGELLEGSTQERTAIISKLVMPGEKTTIAIKCVHASRGIQTGSIFKTTGYSPGKEVYYASQVHTKGDLSGVSQSCSWEKDREYTMNASNLMGSSDDTITSIGDSFSDSGPITFNYDVGKDDLKTVRDKVSKTYKELIAKVPLIDHQIGIAILDPNGFDSLDCYDIPNSWKVVKKSMIEKEALSLAQEDKSGLFEFKPDRAKDIVKKVLEEGFDEKIILDDPKTKTITFAYNGHVGEVVTYEDNVIHLLIARKE